MVLSTPHPRTIVPVPMFEKAVPYGHYVNTKYAIMRDPLGMDVQKAAGTNAFQLSTPGLNNTIRLPGFDIIGNYQTNVLGILPKVQARNSGWVAAYDLDLGTTATADVSATGGTVEAGEIRAASIPKTIVASTSPRHVQRVMNLTDFEKKMMPFDNTAYTEMDLRFMLHKGFLKEFETTLCRDVEGETSGAPNTRDIISIDAAISSVAEATAKDTDSNSAHNGHYNVYHPSLNDPKYAYVRKTISGKGTANTIN